MKLFLLMIAVVALVGGCGKWIHIRPRELNKYGLPRKKRNRQIKSEVTRHSVNPRVRVIGREDVVVRMLNHILLTGLTMPPRWCRSLNQN